jgi:hypothetical protein
MCTFRTITTVGLVLVLAAGAFAADKNGRPGNHQAKPKVQQPNRSKAAQFNPKERAPKGFFEGWPAKVGTGSQLGTSKLAPKTGPNQATDAEIIKALNNGTQLRSTERGKPGSHKPFNGDIGDGTGIFKAERGKPGSQKPYHGDIGDGTGI